MKDVRKRNVWNRAPHLLNRTQKYVGATAAFHALQNRSRRVLQRHIDIGADLFVSGNRFEQAACNFVGIRVEETDPAQVFNVG